MLFNAYEVFSSNFDDKKQRKERIMRRNKKMDYDDGWRCHKARYLIVKNSHYWVFRTVFFECNFAA